MALLATRERLDVYKARGFCVNRAASLNLRLYSLPLYLLIPLGQMNYRMPNLQQFMDENIADGFV